MNKQDNRILSLMIKELQNSEARYQPSSFWRSMNSLHINYLSKQGFDNFKRSVNAKYFQWGISGIIVHQLMPIISGVLKGNLAPLFGSRFSKNYGKLKVNFGIFNDLQQLMYRIYTAYLYDFVEWFDDERIFNKIGEPFIGNPILIRYKNKFISQDLCNSVFDYYSIIKNISLPRRAEIAEIGAGYGRLGYVFLSVLPNSSYCIIDIPPALFIAQNYLSAVFPTTKIFKFRPFKSYQEIQKEFENSRIRFIMPHQIGLLPGKYFDLFINISSLHEMTREQILDYVNQIDKSCKGYFYSKQWRKSRTIDNQFIREDEYPIPKKWRVIKRRSRHPIQNMFFDALYKIR